MYNNEVDRYTDIDYNFISAMTDEEIVKSILLENNIKTKDNLFGQLYIRHKMKVKALCFRYNVRTDIHDDLVQDIFVKTFNKLDSFKGQSRFSTWFYTIAKNAIISYLCPTRDDKLNHQDIKTLYYDDSYEEESTHDFIRYKKQAFSMLSEVDKQLLQMKYQDEYSLEYIKSFMNIWTSATKMRIKRAKERAHEIYKSILDTN